MGTRRRKDNTAARKRKRETPPADRPDVVTAANGGAKPEVDAFVAFDDHTPIFTFETTQSRRELPSLEDAQRASKIEIVEVGGAKVARATEGWGGGATVRFAQIAAPLLTDQIHLAWGIAQTNDERREPFTPQEVRRQFPALADACTDKDIVELLQKRQGCTEKQAAVGILRRLFGPRYSEKSVYRYTQHRKPHPH
jgi:hypothetical protein